MILKTLPVKLNISFKILTIKKKINKLILYSIKYKKFLNL